MEQNKNRTTLYVTLAIVVLLGGFLAYAYTNRSSFVDDGTNVVTPVPVTPVIEGNTADLVSFSVAPGASISGVAVITGSIKGAYFFEANARGRLLDSNKAVLKEFPLQAQGEWMTSDPVSFTATVDATNVPSGAGYIRLMNDNPSGDPVSDKYIDIPVVIN